jgi:DNA-binding response OmpR family regulator
MTSAPVSSTASNQARDEWTSSPKACRLVLAEDDQDLRETLALAMRREGYEVIELEDGWQLLQYLTAQRLADGEKPPASIVISDIRMPGKTGLEVLAGMQWGQRPPPFILVSAFCDAQTRSEASRLGAVALVAKPYNLEQMRLLVRDIESRQVA